MNHTRSIDLDITPHLTHNSCQVQFRTPVCGGHRIVISGLPPRLWKRRNLQSLRIGRLLPPQGSGCLPIGPPSFPLVCSHWWSGSSRSLSQSFNAVCTMKTCQFATSESRLNSRQIVHRSATLSLQQLQCSVSQRCPLQRSLHTHQTEAHTVYQDTTFWAPWPWLPGLLS